MRRRHTMHLFGQIMQRRLSIACQVLALVILFGAFFAVPPLLFRLGGAVACLCGAIGVLFAYSRLSLRRGFSPLWLEFVEMMLFLYCIAWSVIAIVAWVQSCF
jgi:hypothetical protein